MDLGLEALQKFDHSKTSVGTMEILEACRSSRAEAFNQVDLLTAAVEQLKEERKELIAHVIYLTSQLSKGQTDG